MNTENTETSNPEALATLVRAAAAFAYEIARGIKEENAENARALAMVLTDDPGAEFHASVRLAPTKAVVLSVVTGGKQYIIHHQELLDDAGIRH
ncbi:MAG: hypothetical protein WCV99_12410 [Sterolibacterium sp.]|jgi:hypothetical protein